jgi:hypothetical protein
VLSSNRRLVQNFCFTKLYCLTNTPDALRGAVVEALRYNRKVAGSIPDGVIGIFH